MNVRFENDGANSKGVTRHEIWHSVYRCSQKAR